jgi:hypothetical protein
MGNQMDLPQITKLEPLAQIAAELRAGREILAESNRLAARVEEGRFEDLLRKYVLSDPRFRFGGVHNLLASVARVCEELSQLEDDEYEQAAIAIDLCADACDLKYPAAE